MRRLAIGALAVLATSALTASAASAASGAAGTITVRPGQSIQAAVDAAKPGDTIVVKAGTYHESVTIAKNQITLKGAGASSSGTVIVPPATLPDNTCTAISEGGSGICVLGQVDLATGQVRKRTIGVRVTGIQVRGFPGMGVFAFGTQGLQLDHDAGYDNGGYGLARFDSILGSISASKAAGNGEAGIYVGDSPAAHATVTGNTVWDNTLGIFLRHDHFVRASGNTAFGNCQGVLVLDDGQPEGAGDITVSDNAVHDNNKFCPPSEGAPPLQGGGILLLGATDSRVTGNTVKRNQGAQVNSGGIVLLSAAMFGGKDPSGDVVRENTLAANRPADLIWDGSGSGNTFNANRCATSQPAGLCH